jgi:hypothetical protein
MKQSSSKFLAEVAGAYGGTMLNSLCQKRVAWSEIEKLQGNLMALEKEDEKVTLKLVKVLEGGSAVVDTF